jgi:hypothetical protein
MQYSNLTPSSRKILYRTISMDDLKEGACIKIPSECIAWEQRMIGKYGFKVKAHGS